MHSHSLISYSYTLRPSMSRPPFGPLTVPPSGGIFPTDFSSHTPSADCLLAIADVAADPLRAVASICVPLAGLAKRSRRPSRAEALVSRCASSPALFSQYRRISRGTPCCFQYVTVESTEWAAAPFKELVTGAAVCVAFSPHIHPRLYSPTGCQFVPSTLYVRPISLRPASFNPSLRNESLPFATFHVTYLLGLD
jgi:hypothetical protein